MSRPESHSPATTPCAQLQQGQGDAGRQRLRPGVRAEFKGGPQADPALTAEALWHAYGDMVRAASTLRRDDDNWGQAGTLVRQVLERPPATGWPPTPSATCWAA